MSNGDRRGEISRVWHAHGFAWACGATSRMSDSFEAREERGAVPHAHAKPWACHTIRILILAACLFPLAGCRQKMATQPVYRPLRPTNFFRDGQSARPQVFGTIARGELKADPVRFEGKKPW